MKTLSQASQKTLDALRKKAEGKGRMPSLKRVHALLEELGIEHEYRTTSYTPSIGPASRSYCSYHGKTREGYELTVFKGEHSVRANTTDSYYSWNTRGYARNLLEMINQN